MSRIPDPVAFLLAKGTPPLKLSQLALAPSVEAFDRPPHDMYHWYIS